MRNMKRSLNFFVSSAAGSNPRALRTIPSTSLGLNRASLTLIALTGVLALAVFLRFFQLNAVGYNSDEAVYAGQGAAIANVEVIKDIFPIFRAHPMLFQVILALVFSFGANDWLGRAVSAVTGVLTVLLVYALGKHLYGARAGLYGALFFALMPYHVVVTRQVLLDGSMTLCATLSLYMMGRFADSRRPVWLYAAAAGIGLTFLSKEIGFIMVGAIYAFLALSPKLPVRIRDIVISGFILVAVMVPFPLTVLLAGGGGGGKTQQVLIWQLFRRPNHTWDFYPTVVPPAIGFGVMVVALIGLWLLRKQNSWREKLLVLWILVPVVFFQVWPTKGFQYLLPIAPAFAILAARTLAHWPLESTRLRGWSLPQHLPGLLTAIMIAVSLFIPSWQRIHPSATGTFLAGSGGVPGGREMGVWIKENVPEGATFLTIGPSMANIVKWYARERAFGISVSTNPLHRNPSYEPVENPDYQMRNGEIQFLVWDSFSAERTTFFSEKLLGYAEKYHGRVVHTESVKVKTPEGEIVEKPVIIIYEVHP
jgi:Dolichyl-phosphate-mannose-protein mannosyltransferase